METANLCVLIYIIYVIIFIQVLFSFSLSLPSRITTHLHLIDVLSLALHSRYEGEKHFPQQLSFGQLPQPKSSLNIAYESYFVNLSFQQFTCISNKDQRNRNNYMCKKLFEQFQIVPLDSLDNWSALVLLFLFIYDVTSYLP